MCAVEAGLFALFFITVVLNIAMITIKHAAIRAGKSIDLCSVEWIIVIGVDHICCNLQIVLLRTHYSIGNPVNSSSIII